jgi:hypothetical protein
LLVLLLLAAFAELRPLRREKSNIYTARLLRVGKTCEICELWKCSFEETVDFYDRKVHFLVGSLGASGFCLRTSFFGTVVGNYLNFLSRSTLYMALSTGLGELKGKLFTSRFKVFAPENHENYTVHSF